MPDLLDAVADLPDGEGADKMPAWAWALAHVATLWSGVVLRNSDSTFVSSR